MATRSVVVKGNQYVFDARPDRLDFRDRIYTPPVNNLPPSLPNTPKLAKLLHAYVGAGLILDQGGEGACTGFGLSAVINFLHFVRAEGRLTQKDKVSPRMLYHLAQYYDEWAGEDYEGSSCRGALKGWHRHGACLESLWPYRPNQFDPPLNGWDTDAVTRPLGVYYRINKDSVVDMQAALNDIGAIYVSANVHKGWTQLSKKTIKPNLSSIPVIKPSSTIIGGHAFALVGYTDVGFIVQNSWSSNWGGSGFGILPYEDWVANGTDAWVTALGVPVSRAGNSVVSPSYFVRSPSAASGIVFWDNGDNLGGEYEKPLTKDEAYQHTLLMGNNGDLVNCLVTAENAVAAARKVCYEAPLSWLNNTGTKGKPKKLAIYVHGGLNSHKDSIRRIRIMAPYFRENGIYPLFITWHTGALESLGSLLADCWEKLKSHASGPSQGLLDKLKEKLDDIARRITDSTDRALESASNVSVKAIWSEMKENAGRATEDGHALFVLAMHLAELRNQIPDLEIHLIGHSAGSIVLGHLLDLLQVSEHSKVASCTLYAPACTVPFANQYYGKAIKNGVLNQRDFYIHVLSNERELDDNVAHIYRKSLLMLVSRALERFHKMPILGIAAAFDPKYLQDGNIEDFWPAKGMHSGAHLKDLTAWQNIWWGSDGIAAGFSDKGENVPLGNLYLVKDEIYYNEKKSKDPSHGGFDNDIKVVEGTLLRITGAKKLAFPVKNLDY